ncbi:hypothetical protein ABL78_1441 [Leptomonas seymouri]|uniref:J domain-containing protein n=1 Tax=Leptomonas seymouri TaxID=5684 RepID=A0A0N0P8F9_LEPSE|nr:hypothetical protein ABL78_1441 [Leptomonas seymouri]|eukprot:KPI89477.1 hypothetical protein ABL78_1441 [Leptomonas seymouri]
MSAYVTAHEVLTSPSYSDDDVTQWILRIWRELATEPASLTLSSMPPAPISHYSNPSTLQMAALQLFGDKSAVSRNNRSSMEYRLRITDATSLKRRYRQIVLRVHPDKNASAHAAEAFQLVQSCFEYAVSAGSGVTEWTWRQPLGETTRIDEQTAENADDMHVGSVASLPSSLFSSSACSISCTRQSERSSPVSSSSVHGSQSASRVGGGKQRKAAQASPTMRGAKETAAAAVPPATATTVPEPPTLFFPSNAEPSSARMDSLNARLSGNQKKSSFQAPPPPPPLVFGYEDQEEEAASASSECAVPLPSLSGRDARGSLCHNPQLLRDAYFPSTASKDPCHLFHRRGMSEGGQDETWNTASRGPSNAPASERAAEPVFSTVVPPPPPVFDSPPSSPSTAATHKAHAELCAVKVARPLRQRPGLPTLAELLAQLDEEDEMEELDERRSTPLQRNRSSVCADQLQPLSSSFYRDSIFLSDTLQTRRTSLRGHTRHRRAKEPDGGRAPQVGRGVSGVSEKCAFPSNEHKTRPTQRRDAWEAVQLPPSSRALAPETTFGEAHPRDEAATHLSTRDAEHERFHAPSSKVRSRRAGGGVRAKSHGGAWPESSGTAFERCACGLAGRGQCFLCE